MTYTIIGRCPETNSLGIAIATYSLGVGGYCPGLLPGVGVMTSQAFADPRHVSLGLRLLALGYSPTKTISELVSNDDFFEFRQLAIMDMSGTTAVHTGKECRDWKGHRVDDDVIVLGNVLDGDSVLDSMISGFSGSAGQDIGHRLLSSLEAGQAAGGQTGGLTERSASISVIDSETYPLLDLRVDLAIDAVAELRRTFREYVPYIPLYRHLRVKQPDQAPPQESWLTESP